ncbi:radical SAM family heme chaperone HemW [Psychroserpens sp.]|uniref:radical SAM family heme chaperone HemW n=1 Tax=Psychroserpens sp. TaxID=2020870 RepID=UPI001B0A46FF|nr:radical SAM family heme chaperone HemW [Psychroserpens sp.]MBO6605695.1 radical SAM family heme chaperone HemW [Psychroserpens sp.]MBO6630430.1 radical SAM family heme chaperone HemW [Psychroserpens sp.]MBO6652934.1 radical SAM family heme chaperone HemW [Psychroserpens sp.]MBO6681294.1 radical SAM family heme chaperone HemW [Psychroserpens sp.]MBO6749069.1 radical SAM family heme chaperone HemW [Psychroserpens sp.]
MSGIYIHIPFCKQACHYCDFHFSTSLKKKNEMIEAIIIELQLRKQEYTGQTVETIYFGGGTPSLLSNEELQLILGAVDTHYDVIVDPEITLEANPDDLSVTRIKALAQTPINRLSIGIQSFFDEDLKLMNRAHNSEEARKCLKEATKHFENITVDLIYGIPGMSKERWIQNIEEALSYNISHISSYALTVEPKTALASFIQKGIVDNVNDDEAQEHFHLLIDRLDEAGFIHYEISNFGKEGFFSKNNTAYWQGKSYLGIGPSAHSFDGHNRGWNIRNNTRYIKTINDGMLPMEIEHLSVTDKYNEYIMTGLRTIWGVSLNKVEKDFGKSYKDYVLLQAQPLINEHLLYIDDDKLLVTKKGKFLSDGIASDLFKLNLE